MKFLVDDIETEWAYESSPFDFIHARNLMVSTRDFGRLLKETVLSIGMPSDLFPLLFLRFLTKNRSVKPGRWVEFQDWDGYPTSEDGSFNGTGLERYYNEVCGAFEEAGYEFPPGSKLEQWFRDAGFVNINVEKFVVPYEATASGQRIPILSVSSCLQRRTSNSSNSILASSY